MTVLKRYMPLAILGLSFLVFYLLLMNIQVFYGGYKGLLHHGISGLLEAETLEVKAEVRISPQDGNLSDVMEMTFIGDGHMDRKNRKSHIAIQLLNGSGTEGVPIASLVQDGEQLSLIPEGEGAEVVDLSSFISAQVQDSSFDQVSWEQVYRALVISEVTDKDQRRGGGYLQGTFTNYQLDLLTLLKDDHKEMLETLLGQGILGHGLAMADLQIDRQGELAAIRIHIDAGIFEAEGWVTIEEP